MFGENLVLLVVCCLGLCQAMDQHLICKSVHDVFSPTDNTVSPNRGVSQGVPGKMGPPGLRGPEGPDGPRGPPGDVDYEKVNSTIDEKLQPVIRSFCEMEKTMEAKMEDLITEFTSKMENLTETLPTRILQKRGLCDIQYNNSCFWAISHTNSDITQTKAEEICNNAGARVADIYDEEHYGRLMLYLRAKIVTPNTKSCFRLGLVYDHSAQVARKQNGAESYARWYPSTPNLSSSYPTIYIWVRRDPSNSDQGMYNYKPSYTCHGLVCEIPAV